MNYRYNELSKLLGRERVRKNEPLAQYTTFDIGGPADFFYEANTEREVIKAILSAQKTRLPYFILGGGSNILMGDKGFRGLIIKLSTIDYRSLITGSEALVIVGAGMLTGRLLEKLSNESLSGLEFMAGIPGTVGGAVRGNAGAWQKGFGDCVNRVKVLMENGKIRWLGRQECRFSYRESRFKHNNEVILSTELKLKKSNKKLIQKQIKFFLEKRREQPKEPSAGCIFVNPKPFSAGKLIEDCGLKGTKIGKAQISDKHANFIINLGGAKAEDVLKLIDLIKMKVKEKFKIDLKEEIVRVGEF